MRHQFYDNAVSIIAFVLYYVMTVALACCLAVMLIPIPFCNLYVWARRRSGRKL